MKELTKSICSVSVELSKKGQFLYRKFDKEMESDQLYQPINTDPIDFTSIIIDKSNRWRLYPKRNKSISCYSTKIENSYKVFPISNQILIYGNTNSWNTNFEKYLHPLTLVGFNKFIFDLSNNTHKILENPNDYQEEAYGDSPNFMNKVFCISKFKL